MIPYLCPTNGCRHVRKRRCGGGCPQRRASRRADRRRRELWDALRARRMDTERSRAHRRDVQRIAGERQRRAAALAEDRAERRSVARLQEIEGRGNARRHATAVSVSSTRCSHRRCDGARIHSRPSTARWCPRIDGSFTTDRAARALARRIVRASRSWRLDIAESACAGAHACRGRKPGMVSVSRPDRARRARVLRLLDKQAGRMMRAARMMPPLAHMVD